MKKPVFPAVVCVLFLLAFCALPALAQKNVQSISNATVSYPVHSDISAPLSSYAALPMTASPKVHAPLLPKGQQLRAARRPAGSGLNSPIGKFGPSLGLSFDGVAMNPSAPATENCANIIGGQVEPPDTNAAVGDTQVVQWVNLCYAVYDKATGSLVAGPFAGNHFWAGFGGVCELHNDGDPIIQFDKANHVWVASQNTFFPFATCIAVSTTADATGSYNRYLYFQPGFPDYHKWGLQPHAYFQTQNNFGNGSAYVGVTVCAYQADALRAGSKKAKQICTVDTSNGTLFDDSFLPADTDADPAGTGPTPEVFLGSIDNVIPETHVYEYVATVSFKGKGKMKLTGVNGSMPITVPSYNITVCNVPGLRSTVCVPQPSPGSELLDTLGDRLMYRLAVFDDGTNQHFLVTHSVFDTAAIGARWYEFTAPTGSTTLSLAQSGQTPNDAEYRWMGSIARDKLGNISLGYSRSSAAAGPCRGAEVTINTKGLPAEAFHAPFILAVRFILCPCASGSARR